MLKLWEKCPRSFPRRLNLPAYPACRADGVKIRKTPFFCPTHLSAILPLGVAPRRSQSQPVAATWKKAVMLGRPSSAQFESLRPSPTKKNKSESMGHIRKIVPVAGATQGCGQIETGLPRRLVRSGTAEGGNHCGKSLICPQKSR
jgi:hypothetical protein